MGKAIAVLAGIVTIVVGLITIFGSISKDDDGNRGEQSGQLKVSYSRSAFDSGVLAKPHRDGKQLHQMEIRVANECGEQVHVDPGSFALVLPLDGNDDVVKIPPRSPTEFASKWIPNGESYTGRLVFVVPARLPDARDSNSVQHHVRFHGTVPHNCQPSYLPR